MRRICSLLLAVAFCIGVVGCGETPKPQEPLKGTTPPKAKDEKKPAATDEKKPAATEEKK
ncbi:MAG: hypothetical protein NTW87_28235 [Planctomycetota bacterium]|nr:hypothetical protein [Planctomycetota bacterium]